MSKVICWKVMLDLETWNWNEQFEEADEPWSVFYTDNEEWVKKNTGKMLKSPHDSWTPIILGSEEVVLPEFPTPLNLMKRGEWEQELNYRGLEEEDKVWISEKLEEVDHRYPSGLLTESDKELDERVKLSVDQWRGI